MEAVDPVKKYTTKEKVFRAIFVLLALPVLGFTAWCGYTIYNLSAQRAELKKDYSDVNNIQYGLLSVDKWRDNIVEIVNTQIEEFQLNNVSQDTLKREISKILNSVISQADDMMNEKQKNVGSKLKKFAYKSFVNVDKIRARVPEFTQSILNEIRKPSSQARLKYIARVKLEEYASKTRDSLSNSTHLDSLLAKYETTKTEIFNSKVAEEAAAIQETTYVYTFIMLGVILLLLLTWWLIRNMPVLINPMFSISVGAALIVLFTGLASPMIEIDARIQEMNFLLIGKNIQFHDQVLFYQSKSIIDVVQILIRTHKADSILVGILILVFSILFPVFKLLSTRFVLIGKAKWRENKIIRFFAFKSGKWSMADVMVVAIFMAYIGFKGILDSQLAKMDADMTTSQSASIATNKTSLQPGFILFIAFVLFSLILSVILKRISPRKEQIHLQQAKNETDNGK